MLKNKITRAVVILIGIVVVLFGLKFAISKIKENGEKEKDKEKTEVTKKAEKENTPTPTTDRLIATPIVHNTPVSVPSEDATPTPTKIAVVPEPTYDYPTPTPGINIYTGEISTFEPGGQMYLGSDGNPKFWLWETSEEGSAKGYKTITTNYKILNDGMYYLITDTEYFDEEGNTVGHDCFAYDFMGDPIWEETLEEGIISSMGQRESVGREDIIKWYYQGKFDSYLMNDATVETIKPIYSGSQGQKEFTVKVDFTDLTMMEDNPRFQFIYHVTFENGSKIFLFDRVESFPESDFVDIKAQYDVHGW